ncbi:hypothetical protein A5719_05710 [Mycolicibacterium peregrinum]|nr:tyrosine/phenylalanine carboxypeptidase domain-containing protein [Mycolicibacterium peregrinum]OBF44864.1 hypothetical protein A5719_05710 [Mycolicibacterium peregrinum]
MNVDARLTEIERELNFLLNATPINGAEAWRDFASSGFESSPVLESRPLNFDPDLVKRDLYDVEIELVENPALNSLFRGKRDEIARQITLLEDRGTPRFRYGALQLYGEPGDALCTTARSLLELIDPPPITSTSVTATDFAAAAQRWDVLRRHRHGRRQGHRDQRRESGRPAGDGASVRSRHLPGRDRSTGAPE